MGGDARVNYPACVRQERESIRKLQEFWSKKAPQELQRYGPLLEVGEEILKVAEAVPVPKDGHLGFLRIVRECFQFLLVEFDFSITDEQPIRMRFSSGKAYLELECSSNPWMSCQFGPETREQKHFYIYDLLFLYRDQRYRIVPEQLTMNSSTEVQDWFQFIAGVFKQYGRDVLSNQPGIFDRLKHAQAERDAEYAAAMAKLHRAGSQDAG